MRAIRSEHMRPNVPYVFVGYDKAGRRLFREADADKGKRQRCGRPSFTEVKDRVLKEVRDRAKSAVD